MTPTNPNDRRNPDNAGLLKRLASLVGQHATITTQWPRMTIPVEIMDVTVSYGLPLYLVKSRDNPTEVRWTRNITLTNSPK